ncbi:hypothetical protein [Nonomuraea angiospora]|uniref:hypothetical protein n=1 Tax=Nonomuraea angiospora TaxID=46172 RepID=UPI0029A64CFC|nr:hypothetical protein [Nonomuraea angiospora]MDX3109215.1 hypothetical protein [Nonomuraea angiospora]
MGDSIDLRRVEEVLPGRLLRLRAEMRLPGLAGARRHPLGRPDDLHAAGDLRPCGLLGLLYWRAISPFHGPVNVAAAARHRERSLY